MKQKTNLLLILLTVVCYLLVVYLVFVNLFLVGAVLTFVFLAMAAYLIQHLATSTAERHYLVNYITSNLKKLFPSYEKLAIWLSFGLLLFLFTIPAFLPMFQR